MEVSAARECYWLNDNKFILNKCVELLSKLILASAVIYEPLIIVVEKNADIT